MPSYLRNSRHSLSSAAGTEQFGLLHVRALLAKTEGNVTRAAELAGVNRRSLQRLIASLGLRDASSRPLGDEPPSRRSEPPPPRRSEPPKR